MHPVQKHLFATNFRDLAGTRLEGTIALSDELINLGLGELLAQLKTSTPDSDAPPAAKKAAPTSALPDPQALLALLDVKKLQYRTGEGRTFLEVEVSLE